MPSGAAVYFCPHVQLMAFSVFTFLTFNALITVSYGTYVRTYKPSKFARDFKNDINGVGLKVNAIFSELNDSVYKWWKTVPEEALSTPLIRRRPMLQPPQATPVTHKLAIWICEEQPNGGNPSDLQECIEPRQTFAPRFN